MKRKYRLCVLAAAGIAAASAVAAQSSITMPQVTPVNPPSINAPQGTVQIPGGPTSGSIQKPQQNANGSGAVSSGSIQKQEEKRQNLSASQISSLLSGSDSSFLDGILGIQGNTIARGSVAKQNATEDILTQILRSLEGIQNRESSAGQTGTQASGSVAKPGAGGVTSSGSVAKPDSDGVIASGSVAKPGSGTQTRPPQYRPGQSAEDSLQTDSRILRFRVNGYNVLDTCKVVYFSKPAADGSFLLTGDRKYVSDGALRDETFYLLFKKSKIRRDGSVEYSVAADVSQDYANQYSFLYQLAGRSPVTAVQTGNMIVLRTDDPSWRMDMLIDYAYQVSP